MKCPIDNEPLVMTDRSGVEIDYCPTCRGVWLDRGELDKIIDRAAASTSAPRGAEPPRQSRHDERPRYDERRNDGDREKYASKKKGSFLGELFDF